MPKLSDLGLGNEAVGADFSNIPEQRGGGMQPLMQPGKYVLRLPKFDLNSPIFEAIDAQRGKRVSIVCKDEFALTVVSSPAGKHNGEPFTYRLNNAEMNVARKGEPEIFASDLDYLLRDAFKQGKAPKTNAEYVKALVAFAGKSFSVDLEFTWNCNNKREIYADDGEGGTAKVDGTLGCGARYYQGGKNGVAKVHEDENDPNSPMIYPERIACGGKDGIPCAAIIRAFPRLRNFKPAPEGL